MLEQVRRALIEVTLPLFGRVARSAGQVTVRLRA